MSVETLPKTSELNTATEQYDEARSEVLAIASRLHDGGDLADSFRSQMGVLRTPLVETRDTHWDLDTHSLLLKDESSQKTSAYKVRGAASSVLLAHESNPELEYITCGSAGNFALGVAHASRMLGLEAHVYMRDGASAVKLAKLQKLNANLHNHYTTLADAISAATIAGEEGVNAHFAHPYNSPEVIAGQSTVMHEILRDTADTPDLDWQKDRIELVVPGGGKGLAAGTALELEQAKRDGLIGDNVRLRVVEVQDEDEHGNTISKEHIAWCDGTATADGALGALLLRGCSIEITTETVTPLEVAVAMDGLQKTLRNRVEPAGALSAAGVGKMIKSQPHSDPTTFIAVVSGGNASRDTMYEAMRLRGKVYNYRASLPSMGQEALLRAMQ